MNVAQTWNFSDLSTTDAATSRAFYAALFGWEFDDTLVRRPGYGAHLQATVYPDIVTVQSQINAPPGFEDAVAWLVNGDTNSWQVSFAVEDRDSSAERAESLGASVIAHEDTEWTRTVTIRDPQGALLTLSQFTPPN